MGLFSRSNPIDDDSSEQYEEIELPSSNDIQKNVFNENDTKLDLPVSPSPAPSKSSSSKTGYGIEDAIGLMKALPRDNNEVVVTVVKKTLESTSIQVEDIIEDANSKEERIRSQHKLLEDEIKQLEQQIAQRNQQISDLLQDLKETTDVRQRLELALNLDKKSAPKRPEAAINESKAEAKATTPEDDKANAQRTQSAPSTQAQQQNRRPDNTQQAARRRQGSERSTNPTTPNRQH